MNRSAIDILLDYPREKGIPYETHENEKRFLLNPLDPSLKSRYVYFREAGITFFAFDSYALKAGSTNTFSGIYTEFKVNESAEFSIYKKEWIHKLLLRNKRTTGIKQIDENLTIVSKQKFPFGDWFDIEAVSEFVNLTQKIVPLKMIVRNDYLSLVPALKGKNIIGLETNQWLYKKEDLSTLIERGSKLLATLSGPSY